MKRMKLILEFSEFNAMRLNPDSAQMGVHVDNPQLSINAFDRHEDGIRAGISRINNIINSLSNSANFRALKSKLSLEDQKVTSLKVLRISKPDDVCYDAFISFVIDETEYFGVIKNILTAEPVFKSEVFKDSDLIQTKEWIIKLKGTIVKTVKQWLHPQPGQYKLLRDSVTCNSVDTGKQLLLRKDTVVRVVRAYDNTIVIECRNDYYNLVNDNFVYFNYWFEPIVESIT